MKTLTWLGGVVVAVTVMLGGASLAPAPVRAQAKPIVWNLPHVAAPTYPTS